VFGGKSHEFVVDAFGVFSGETGIADDGIGIDTY
jgi:hypothetical protein